MPAKLTAAAVALLFLGAMSPLVSGCGEKSSPPEDSSKAQEGAKAIDNGSPSGITVPTKALNRAKDTAGALEKAQSMEE